MDADDIDRVLSNEPEIEPSPTFALRVVDAVRRELETGRSPVGPARRLWPAWTTAALLAFVSTVSAAQLRAALGAVPAVGLDGATWLSLILPCSLAFGWWSARSVRGRTARVTAFDG